MIVFGDGVEPANAPAAKVSRPPKTRAVRKRTNAVRVRPLFRSIVDFRTPDALPASATSVPPVIASEQPTELSVICAVMASDRTPVPDALVTMTPMAMDGSINGAMRLARSGLDGLARMPTMPSASYRIAVRVTFQRGSGTPPATLRGNFRTCAVRQQQAPAVTG